MRPLPTPAGATGLTEEGCLHQVHIAIAGSADHSQIDAALRIATIAADQQQWNPPLIAAAIVGESTAGPPQNMIEFQASQCSRSASCNLACAARSIFSPSAREFLALWLKAACADRARSSSFLRFFRSPPDRGIGMTRLGTWSVLIILPRIFFLAHGLAKYLAKLFRREDLKMRVYEIRRYHGPARAF